MKSRVPDGVLASLERRDAVTHPMAPPPLHPDVAPLAFLLGTWTGEGGGRYPTIRHFSYGEEARFWHVGKPFVAYSQRTWSLEDRRPLHAETGYWRVAADGQVELVLAHPTGIVEVARGRVDGLWVRVATTTVAGTPTAKRVDHVEREIWCDGDTLSYEVRMAAVGQPLGDHLRADLRRQD